MVDTDEEYAARGKNPDEKPTDLRLLKNSRIYNELGVDLS